MICLCNKNVITWKGSLVDMEGCDLILEHLGEEKTSNHKIELRVFGYGVM